MESILKKGLSILLGILLILCFDKVSAFFTWLFVLDYTKPTLSIAGEIVVRFLTFAISYTVVGVIFKFKNRRLMSFIYFIVSTLIGFVLAYIVWCFETYILIFGIVFAIILVLVIVISVLLSRKIKREKEE